MREKPTKSAICIGGLIKHVTHCERGWIDTMLQRPKKQTLEETAAT